jgi:hypothetical protein
MNPPSRDRIPLESNERALMLLARLRRGPASTLDLQSELPLVHVARQVWELRHWYGFAIKTSRAPNRIAVYTLGQAPQAPESRQETLFGEAA